MMPTRAKVRRVCFLKNGMSSTRPRERLAAFEHAGVEQAVDVGGLGRPVTYAALWPLDFDGRLEPVHAARAGAYDLDVEPALLDGLEQSAGHLVGADAERA